MTTGATLTIAVTITADIVNSVAATSTLLCTPAPRTMPVCIMGTATSTMIPVTV